MPDDEYHQLLHSIAGHLGVTPEEVESAAVAHVERKAAEREHWAASLKKVHATDGLTADAYRLIEKAQRMLRDGAETGAIADAVEEANRRMQADLENSQREIEGYK
jgi:fatty acid-binding protein DegV